VLMLSRSNKRVLLGNTAAGRIAHTRGVGHGLPASGTVVG
jgi:hypothetical protein